MRAYAIAIFVLLAGCDSFKNVPCGQCEKYGAVCNPVTNTCQLGPLDMAVTVENDMAKTMVADLSTDDGPTPPMCTPATVTTDCVDAAKPVCGSDGNCRACNSAGDDAVCKQQSPATPRCQLAGANAGQCVQCTAATQATDCGGIAPICGSDGNCRKCQAHAECSSLGTWADGTAIPGVCIFDGVNPGGCADPALIAYVDNKNKAVSACKADGTTHDGTTPANSYCDIQDAVIAVGGQPFVVVRGRGATNDYGDPGRGGTAVSISRPVTLIGPGGQAATTALISTAASGISCVTVSGTANAVIDGFEIGDADGALAINCTGTSLVGRRNYVHSATLGGVAGSGCEVTLDGNYIDSNAGGGISLSNNSTYSLTNNIISSNGSGTGGFGVQINSSPAGSVFAFNTVANNQAAAGFAPGVQCNAPGIVIVDSIVALNTPLLSGSQMTAGCTLMNTVTGPDSATGANMAAPAFTTSYRLDISSTQNEMKNKTCCIDKLATPSTPFSDHDVDFTARPKGTAATPYDIGAAEAE